MGRSPCCADEGGVLKKGPWTPEEDEKLLRYVQGHGHGSWRNLPRLAGLNRCGKSCRLRWTNYLRPDIKRGKFSQDEENTILHLHSILGNKWSAMATQLPGRTDNEIKNYWNTHLKKRLIRNGFDPMTHRPRTDFFAFDALPQLLALAALHQQHQQQLDPASAQMQGTGNANTDMAVLQQAAKLQYLQCLLQSISSTTTSSAAPVSSVVDVAAISLGGAPAVSEAPVTVTISEEAARDHQEGLLLSSDLELEMNYSCHGGGSLSSLPPLADFSDGTVDDGRCSATASSGFGDGAGGGSSPLTWPEFFFPDDDPFVVTDFL
ncbi:transcription factor MYB93 [Brachypodium distachyon]|uniref:Uncharacterized protein n=1 Tax=Brachypodium distachyon TaxID=15368 RepID=I1I829_BRADI|nr:transcription factor MYB93 [Brachypodium distachyon]KQJ98746.1 hypothetical protein BRADI_3g38807v3 [Brachypodium distachyon]|eukprot:XP_003572317.1 transcription factor MYB93 [Brachypodium distachyon]